MRMIKYQRHVEKLPKYRLPKIILMYDQKFSNFGTVNCWSTEMLNIKNINYLGHLNYMVGKELFNSSLLSLFIENNK